jgi:hypothetical protein
MQCQTDRTHAGTKIPARQFRLVLRPIAAYPKGLAVGRKVR